MRPEPEIRTGTDEADCPAAAGRARVLEAALQAIGDPFLLLDRSFHIEEINGAMAALLGRERKRLFGHNPLAFLRADKRRLLKKQAAEALLSQKGTRFDLAMLGHWYEISLSPVACDGGQAAYIAVFVRDITDRRAMEEVMRFQAYHDPMTKLPNRRWLDEHLTELIDLAKRRLTPMTVMFFDLDGMKRVNDTYGHGIGDELLKEVSRRLEGAIRASDLLLYRSGDGAENVVSRIGGDEFVLVLPSLSKRKDAEQVAERLLSTIGEPFFIDGHLICVSASIGIAYVEESAIAAEELIYQADQAMYLAKYCGRGRWCFSDELEAARPKRA